MAVTVRGMNLLDQLNDFLAPVEGWLWIFPGVPVVLLLSLYFTWRTKGVQFRMIPLMIRSIVERAQREAGTRGRRRRTKRSEERRVGKECKWRGRRKHSTERR